MPRNTSAKLANHADAGFDAVCDDMPPDHDELGGLEPLDTLEAIEELAEAAVDSYTPPVKGQGRARKAVVPPAVIPEGMSLFDYVRQCTPPIDQKLVDIACSQALVPDSLRGDAQQEIYILWNSLRPDVSRFKPGQIAAYAHRMAKNAALKLRRELGSPVRLPGSAFRRRRDGSSYVTPGVLAAPLNWDDMEAWFQADDSQGMGGELAAAAASVESMVTTDGESTESSEEQMQKARLRALEANKHKLTPTQQGVLRLLVDGHSYDDIMRRMMIKRGVLMREVAIACSVLGPL